ncbi:GNAT family N-acetyltransferase [Chromobacterium alticapitis]|uniref:N-acetyltransferase n=1 Tax=Chromobacterium alticapitis TaxID=2073169 RepID=A0A2S5DLQ8_9NEIS|nr:GNAT family N-acetyltransferase [Chromobacterium alticapitis]POZ63997.1 N-acetyltransferase [Chromobacterium alticapitis]
MLIRKADAQDLDAVCRLTAQINRQHHLAMPELFRGDVDMASERAFWAERMEGEDRAILLAVLDGETLAFASLMTQTSPPLPFLQPRRICRIGTIVVDEAHQGQGIGSLLLAAAEDWGRGQDADELRLEVMDFNHGAQAFYARHGLAAQSQIMSKPLFGDQA